ncbi:MAG: threonine synthase [Eubacteriaceae bacterium]|jgi:threonine synthase|nr:threonine synthase [Eubacteriaceae bacterium]
MGYQYTSTRDSSLSLPASQCILRGISEEGGLFVSPLTETRRFEAEAFLGLGYPQTAKAILSTLLDDYTEEEVSECVERAYNLANFETGEIFPLTTKGSVSVLELYHGKTLAFKDAALSILPHLMKTALGKNGLSHRIAILTATSGDTGKAALESFSNIDGFDAIAFYPHNGVGALQKLQMLTQEGSNTAAAAVVGNFDDAQAAVKEIFADESFGAALLEKGVALSSANSINIGRLLPQIVYYYYAYAKLRERGLIEDGEKVNFAVPSGNFGDILAGYYAMKTGLPVKKLILASNDNAVLYDFFRTGVYDRRREFRKTISPSMDILISSNLERLIFSAVGYSDRETSRLMGSLAEKGYYSMDSGNKALGSFYAARATESETRAAIKSAWEEKGLLIDTHTACAYKAWQVWSAEAETGNEKPHTVILGTASPFKFPKTVLEALFGTAPESEIDSMHALSEKTGHAIPRALDGIELKKARKEQKLEKGSMREYILRFLEG